MTPRPRQLVRDLAARVIGERAAPVGGVARDRRLLRRALGHRTPGRVLVVGPGLAVRQVLPGLHVDVAGPLPHLEVTVCSSVDAPGSLPPARWDTVVVTDPGRDLAGRLAAVRTACRPGGRVLVLDRTGDVEPVLARVADVEGHVGRRPRVWTAAVRA